MVSIRVTDVLNFNPPESLTFFAFTYDHQPVKFQVIVLDQNPSFRTYLSVEV